MPEPSPAYLWYPKDVLSSGRVAELSAAEECWYRRALDHSWLSNGLPDDARKLALRIGKGCTSAAAQKLLDIFFKRSRKDPTKMVNETQEKVRRKLIENRRQKSLAGKKGMEKRWKGDKQKTSGDNSVITPLITKNNIPSPSSFPISFPISSFDFKRLIENACEKNSKIDPRLIEIAVIETLIKRNGSTEPIQSLKYFSPEIERLNTGASGKTLDGILQRRRDQITPMLIL